MIRNTRGRGTGKRFFQVRPIRHKTVSFMNAFAVQYRYTQAKTTEALFGRTENSVPVYHRIQYYTKDNRLWSRRGRYC